MSLIHPGLIAAAALAVIPVILHFLLRAKPKKLIFPALRLIQLRRRQNVRRLRLRHVWLMLLRVLVIVGLVIAVARPSVPEANYELSTREFVTLIALIAVAAGTYFGVMWHWRRRRVSVQTLAYRRTLLRGGVGAALAALIGLAVIWPYANRLRAEISAPTPPVGSDLPVAAVFLFDTSLSMQYQQEGKTRLDQAKQIALSHIDRLPPRSRIAVGETSSGAPPLFQADTVTAKSKIQNLVLQPVTVPLNERLSAALQLQQTDQGRTLDEQQAVAKDARRDRFVREVYLFTDLAASAWRTASASLLKDELERLSWIGVYVIDVGEVQSQDVAISEILLPRQSVAAGSTVIVEANVTSIGFEEAERIVELSLKSRDGKLVKSGTQSIKIGAASGPGQASGLASVSRSKVQIPVANLQGPVQHGELRLLSSDPLVMNDVRHFTIEVKPPPKVLHVAPTAPVGELLTEALAPPGLVQTGRARYEVDEIRPAKLSDSKFSDYAAVVLNSVPAITEPVWKALSKYVSNGGGLLVVLGSSTTGNDPTGVRPETYNTDFVKTLLPATPAASLNFIPSPQFFDPKNLEHPALKRLEEFNAASELSAVEIRRHWKVDLQDGANVLMPYSNSARDAALIERRVGAGRVMLLTTALDLRGWNDLPQSWSFVALADQLMQYLSGRQEAAFNFWPNDRVTLRFGNETPPQKYLVRKPGGQQKVEQLAAGTVSISIGDTDQLGHYDVISDDPQSNFGTGFSVNVPPGENDFRRLTNDDLTQMLGEKRFSVARDIGTLERRVATGRLGEELYPLLLVLAIIVFCGEHFVANWFYSEDTETAAAQ